MSRLLPNWVGRRRSSRTFLALRPTLSGLPMVTWMTVSVQLLKFWVLPQFNGGFICLEKSAMYPDVAFAGLALVVANTILMTGRFPVALRLVTRLTLRSRTS